MILFLVVEIRRDSVPRIIGLFADRSKAEKTAYSVPVWRNVIPLKIIK